jgi:plastocyanin domain-containing protein
MKPTIIAIVIGGALVLGAFTLSRGNTASTDEPIVSNVSIENGKQIVTISAKGGYSPKVTEAKADMPTTLRVETQGTFDCSSTLAIPSMNYQKNLPPSGVTEVELLPQKAGSTFEGLCGMGMYRFEIAFK